VRSSERAVVFVDLGVPRTIDPTVGALPGVLLFDIDDLERGSAETRELAATDTEAAKRMVATGCDEFQQWWAARESAPAIAALTQEAEHIRLGELERALRKLDHLSDRDKNVVAALSVGIVNKLLHQPVSTLRTDPGRGETAEAIRKLFGLILTTSNSVDIPISGESPNASAQAAD
jgi:glutamyl-tRNA reductase